jgi:hypothetical protein
VDPGDPSTVVTISDSMKSAFWKSFFGIILSAFSSFFILVGLEDEIDKPYLWFTFMLLLAGCIQFIGKYCGCFELGGGKKADLSYISRVGINQAVQQCKIAAYAEGLVPTGGILAEGATMESNHDMISIATTVTGEPLVSSLPTNNPIATNNYIPLEEDAYGEITILF